jgi:hypothetical protein
LLALQRWFNRNYNNDPHNQNYHRPDTDCHGRLNAVVVTGNGLDEMPEDSKRSQLWMGIGIQLVSFVVWAIIAIFFLGGSRQKMVTLGRDMDQWKQEWKERDKHITKMDLEGSVATKNFVTQYEKEQAKQYERLKHLEDEVSHLETMELKIDRLEKRLGEDGRPR